MCRSVDGLSLVGTKWGFCGFTSPDGVKKFSPLQQEISEKLKLRLLKKAVWFRRRAVACLRQRHCYRVWLWKGWLKPIIRDSSTMACARHFLNERNASWFFFGLLFCNGMSVLNGLFLAFPLLMEGDSHTLHVNTSAHRTRNQSSCSC